MTFDRIIIVGDTHGCLDELVQLLDEKLCITHDDLLITAGDLLDKGPFGPELVQELRRRVEAGQPFMGVMGNHDWSNLQFARHSKGKGTGEKAENAAKLTEEDLQFLETFKLWVKVPGHDALVVHAGVMPNWKRLPSDEELAKMGKKEWSKWARCMRVRHILGEEICKVTVEFEFGFNVADLEDALDDGSWVDFAEVRRSTRKLGSFVSFGEERSIDPFWADVYDGRFGHVFFGHNPWKKAKSPKQFPHATGLDLGAVYGRFLAAAVLTEEGVTHTVIPAKQRYSDNFKES